MHEELGKPPIMLVDNWPIVPPMVIVASHEVAEQISRPSKDFQYSAPKSRSVDRIMNLIGPNSILFKQVWLCLTFLFFKRNISLRESFRLASLIRPQE